MANFCLITQVLQVESLTVKIQTHGEESLELLKSHQFLPVELIVASIEVMTNYFPILVRFT